MVSFLEEWRWSLFLRNGGGLLSQGGIDLVSYNGRNTGGLLSSEDWMWALILRVTDVVCILIGKIESSP